jgi:hypothetical protein
MQLQQHRWSIDAVKRAVQGSEISIFRALAAAWRSLEADRFMILVD